MKFRYESGRGVVVTNDAGQSALIAKVPPMVSADNQAALGTVIAEALTNHSDAIGTAVDEIEAWQELTTLLGGAEGDAE